MSGVKTRPILALTLVIIMAVSVLTGCSGYTLKKKEEPVALAKADKSDIFTEIPTPLDLVTTSSVGDEDDLGEAGLIFSSAFAKNDRYPRSRKTTGIIPCTRIWDLPAAHI